MQLLWAWLGMVCLYLGATFCFRIWANRQSEESFQTNWSTGVAGFLAVVFLIGLALCHIIFGMPTLATYAMTSFLGGGVLFCSAKWPCQKKIWMPIVCAAGTYVACQSLPELSQTWFSYALMILTWVSVMAMVMFFDCLPFLSAFTIAAWTVAFSTVILTMENVPLALVAICWLLLVPLWALLKVLSVRMIGGLGPYGAAFVGFMMGGIVATAVGYHAYGSALALMSYYLFEGVLFVLAWLGLHPLGMSRGEFAYLIALQKGDVTRIMKTIFYHLVVLALLAVLVWPIQYRWAVVLIIAIVLVDIYSKFSLFKQPEPTIRSVWKETKESLKELWQRRGSFCAATPKKEQVKKKSTPKPKKSKTKTTKRKKKK